MLFRSARKVFEEGIGEIQIGFKIITHPFKAVSVIPSLIMLVLPKFNYGLNTFVCNFIMFGDDCMFY